MVLLNGQHLGYRSGHQENDILIQFDGVDRLPADMRAQLKGLWDFNPQTDENMTARLYVPE